MKKELYHRAAAVMAEIDQIERQQKELSDMGAAQIIIKASWSEVKVSASDKLASKVRSLIVQELTERLEELQSEFEEL